MSLAGLDRVSRLFMPGDTTTGDTILETEGKPEQCDMQGCNKEPITNLEGGIPTCGDHTDVLAERAADQKSGARPIASNNDNAAAWLADEKDKNGNAYLSVKVDGESENIFPDSDLLQQRLNEMHDLKK